MERKVALSLDMPRIRAALRIATVLSTFAVAYGQEIPAVDPRSLLRASLEFRFGLLADADRLALGRGQFDAGQEGSMDKSWNGLGNDVFAPATLEEGFDAKR